MGRGEVAEGGFTGTAAEPDELPGEVPGAAAEGAVGAGGVAGLVADSSRALGESALTARWPFLSWSGAPSPEPAQQVAGGGAGELPGEVPAGGAKGAMEQGVPWPGPAGLGVPVRPPGGGDAAGLERPGRGAAGLRGAARRCRLGGGRHGVGEAGAGVGARVAWVAGGRWPVAGRPQSSWRMSLTESG